MSGSTPLGGGSAADPALASVVDRLVEKELASLAADAKNLRELVSPGEVLSAIVRPSNGLTDILEILGNRVAAALPPTLVPGDVIAVRVTGFDGERIVLQNLGPIPDQPVAEAPTAPASPQPGAVFYVSDEPANPDLPGMPAAPAAQTIATAALPTPPARPTAVPEPPAPTDLAGSNIVPLPRDGSGSGDDTGGNAEDGLPGDAPAGAAPSGGPPAQPTQEELRARFTVDVSFSRIIIGSRAAVAPPTPPPPPTPRAPDRLTLITNEFSDLAERAPRPNDGLPRVAIDAALLAKIPPTVPPGAELVEAVQQELFADVAGMASGADADELRASPVPPPVRGDVAIPRPLSGDGIPVPSVPDRDGIAAPPSVPRQVVPAASVQPQTPAEPRPIPAFIGKRIPVPHEFGAETQPPEATALGRPGELESRIAAARAAIRPPQPPAQENRNAPFAAATDASTDRTPDDAAGVRRPFVPPVQLSTSSPRISVATAPPTIPQRLPSVPPVIPARVAPGSLAQASTPAAAAQPAAGVPREPIALLKALGLPQTQSAVAAARLALERPGAVPDALQALEAALPADDPRTATLRTIVAFVARLDPESPTFGAQLAAYVDHVIGGPESALRTLAAAAAVAASAAADPDAEGAGLLETLALARVAERTDAAGAHVKTQITALLALAEGEPGIGAAAPALQNALATLTAHQAGGAPPGTNVGPNVVEFALPLPLTGAGHVARIRIERDHSRVGALDGDDFRIAFVLDTKHYGTVAIDLATVGRTVDVGVKTEAPRAADAFAGSLAELRSRLERLHYRVASAHADVAPRGLLPEHAWPPPKAPIGGARDANALVDRDV
jgi:hypothetical protein